jgi:hypothetical protein
MNQPPALPMKMLQGAVPDRVRQGRLFCLAELEDDSFDSAQRIAKPTKVLPINFGRSRWVRRVVIPIQVYVSLVSYDSNG